MRWKLLDRIDELEPGRRARGVFGVSFELATLDRPDAVQGELPRLLAVEAIAELASWLIVVSTGFERRPLAGSFERVRLGRSLGMGERTTVECELHKIYETAAQVSGTARVGDEVVAEIERASCALLELESLEDPDDVRAELSALYRQREGHP